MGLTFKKRDDLDKLLDSFGVMPDDMIVLPEEEALNSLVEKKKVDPFAKWLEPKADEKENKN